MTPIEITVAQGQAASPFVNLRAEFAAQFEKWQHQAALVEIICPANLNQATADLEFSEDGAEGTGSALYDQDGQKLSGIATAAGRRIRLDWITYCNPEQMRIVLPANASAAFTFKVKLRSI